MTDMSGLGWRIIGTLTPWVLLFGFAAVAASFAYVTALLVRDELYVCRSSRRKDKAVAALAKLVQLHDGPRGDRYVTDVLNAYDEARAALAERQAA